MSRKSDHSFGWYWRPRTDCRKRACASCRKLLLRSELLLFASSTRARSNTDATRNSCCLLAQQQEFAATQMQHRVLKSSDLGRSCCARRAVARAVIAPDDRSDRSGARRMRMLRAIVWILRAIMWMLRAIVWMLSAIIWMLRAIMWMLQAVRIGPSPLNDLCNPLRVGFSGYNGESYCTAASARLDGEKHLAMWSGRLGLVGTGIFPLPSCDWCPLRVCTRSWTGRSISPCGRGGWGWQVAHGEYFQSPAFYWSPMGNIISLWRSIGRPLGNILSRWRSIGRPWGTFSGAGRSPRP
eukprot:3820629-Pyramimonas_sp.AAC.1